MMDAKSAIRPQDLGDVLDRTEMDVDEVELLQQSLDKAREKAKRRRTESPPPANPVGAGQSTAAE